MLRLTGHDERVEEWLRPIPFPRHRATQTDRSETLDSTRLVEEALDRVQHDLDDLNRLMSGPLPFPFCENDDDDGPSAA